MKQPIEGLLGLAFAAKKLVYGEKAMESIRLQKALLVVLADDVAPNSKKKILDKCAYYQVPVKLGISREVLSRSIGKHDIVMVSIIEEGFAKKILQA